jgi:hypothetical protein
VTKDTWLATAEVIDALRVIPRIMLFGWLIFYMFYTWGLTEWYFMLQEPSTQQTAFVTTIISALGTMSIWLGNIYINTRRAWSNLGGG